MERVKDKLEILIQQGEYFTYENFSSKGTHGYPDAYTPEWIGWRTRVISAIKNLLGEDSAPMQMLKNGLNVRLLGNGDDKFKLAQAYFIGALKATGEVLKEDTFNELINITPIAPEKFSNEVFIVHGHDDRSKAELDVFLKEIGLNPIVLHRKPDEGQTIIEKFENHSSVGYAFIVMTPDEVAYLTNQESISDEKRVKEKRSRPNVIFEFGFFVGKLGRSRVCCLYTGDVALPSDISGFLYKKFEKSIDEVAYSIIKELKAGGYKLK